MKSYRDMHTGNLVYRFVRPTMCPKCQSKLVGVRHRPEMVLETTARNPVPRPAELLDWSCLECYAPIHTTFCADEQVFV